MVGATTLTPIRLGVPPAPSPGSAGNPNCGPARKLQMRRSLSCMGPGAPVAPPSPKDPDDAYGGLESVIARGTREAPPLWPSRSSGRAIACPPAQPPAGHVAAVNAAGCSRPGGAPADATPAGGSCPVPPGVTEIWVPVPPGVEHERALMGRPPASRGCCTTSPADHPPAATKGAGGAPLGSEAKGSVVWVPSA